MNHRLRDHASAVLSLVGVPWFFENAAESDFRWQLRVQRGLASLPTTELVIKEAECRVNTAQHRSNLRRKTFLSFAWVMSAALVAAFVFVFPVLSIEGLTTQQAFAAASVFCFSWGTLGRLGWNERSYGGSTLFEELDAVIFWMLYWVGTLFGIAATVNSVS